MKQLLASVRKTGFTLIELLAVIVIIMILFGILMAALSNVKENAKKKLARTTVQTLNTAILNYRYEFRKYPCVEVGKPPSWGTADIVFSTDNYLVISALTSSVPPMLRTSEIILGSNGSVLDPWLSPYLIEIDTDEDNSIPGGVKVRSSNVQ